MRGQTPSTAGRFLLDLVLPLEHRLAVGDPLLRRIALQVIPEPLQDALLVVLLVLVLRETVVLRVVLDHHDVLLGAAGDVVHLDALVPEHRAVVVADFEQQRHGHVLNVEHR